VAALIAGVILLATHWGQVTAFIGEKMSVLGTVVHVIVGSIGNAFSAFGTKVHDVWNGIWGKIKEVLNHIIDGIDSFITGLNKLHIDVGDVHVGFDIPTIPHLATGGLISQSGWAVVGERGPELAYLPKNTQVYPHGSSFGQQQQQIVVQPAPVMMDGRMMAQALWPYLVDQIRINVGSLGI